MKECRYCFEYIPLNDRLYPCKCKAPVHYNCLLLWNQARDSNRSKCEICNYYYDSYDWKYIKITINYDFVKDTLYQLLLYLITTLCVIYYIMFFKLL